MKKIIIIFFFLKFSLAFGQIDTCKIDTTAYNFYFKDATYLTILNMQNDTTNAYHDSIHVPAVQVNRILKSLGMVYYNTTPERDTVINIYNIHTSPCSVPNHMIDIGVDTTYLWVKNYIVDSVISGNSSFDSLVANNGFRLIDYLSSFSAITIATDSIYNLDPISKKLTLIPGVSFADDVAGCLDGDYFTFSSVPAYDEITYSHGWMDCPSGCIYRRYWQFRVYPNCTSVFIGSWGNTIITSVAGDVSKNLIFVSPNPFSYSTNLSTYETFKNSTLKIYDIFGKVVHQERINNQSTVINRNSLSDGIYFYQLVNDKGQIESGKFVIE